MLLNNKLVYGRFAVYFSGVEDFNIGEILQEELLLYRVLDFITLFHKLKGKDYSAVV